MTNSRRSSDIQFSCGLRELVRGEEQNLLKELLPLAQSQSVCLDLGTIERIDAAGLAALISLYGESRKVGHELTLVNPTPHVARILAIVGLDRMLQMATIAA